jgi:hypothetical protein
MLWMRSLSLALATLFLSAAAIAQEPSSAEVFHNQHGGRFAGARHVIVEPQHVLSEAERAELESRGLTLDRPLSQGRYLARLAATATVDERDPLLRSIETIAPERKLHPTAIHEAAKGGAFAGVDIVFNDEVSLEQAQAAVEAAGGTVDRTLATDFDLPRNLRAHIPARNVMKLAADERVFTIYGPKPRIAADNLVAAQTSRVDIVQGPPYGLNGDGVVLSYFELSPADTTHPEFGGRLTTHFPANAGTSDQDHATHTAGTMIAAGNLPALSSAQAKGMAPAATLHGYSACDDCNWLADKRTQVPAVGSVADNNSWGYVLGWCFSRCNAPTNWLWTGNDEYIAAYDSTDAAIDKIARTGPTLFVHSAGNEASNSNGPSVAPYAHNHVDNDGNTLTNETFCYSQDGSGNDCPAPQCTAGPAHCEVVRHPTHGAVGSLGLTAASKNVMAVGATDSGKNVTSFSSRGPARDGRVKPDIMAKGFNTLSTLPNNQYGRSSGTSMSAPVVTGISALLTQQYRKSFNNANPLPTTLKALLIAGAVDTGNPGPDYTNGFGFADAKNSVDVIIADGGQNKRISIANATQGSQTDLPLTLSGAQNLRVVLAWADPEIVFLGGDDIASKALVNDLDLVVRDPNGNEVLPYILDKDNPGANATRGVNKVDNVEEVEIAGAAAGTYHVIVKGTHIAANAPQQFVVVSTGGALGQSAPPCTDPTEPNDSAAQAFGFIGSGQHVTARLCEAGDSDFFKVRVEKAGPLTVSVTSNGTPLTVTLTGNGVTNGTANVAAGATGTVSANVTTVPGEYTIQVTANGALGSDTSYVVAPSFTAATPARTHAARP